MVILDNKKNIRSFGRINSRGILNTEKEIINTVLPTYSIDLNYKTDINKINYLEIGFGYGESIAERAKNNNQINYIACETYIKGVLNLLNLIKINNISNIKIFNGDARLLLDNLQNNSLDMVFILFPDPWPKKKHYKRRIINENFLEIISKKLKNNGHLFFASDIDGYINWTIEKVKNNNNFIELFNISTYENEPQWWIKTKYQIKAINEGRKPKFLEWKILKK